MINLGYDDAISYGLGNNKLDIIILGKIEFLLDVLEADSGVGEVDFSQAWFDDRLV